MWNNLRPTPVRVGLPRENVVGELNIEDFFETHLQVGIVHRHERLDAIVEVALHHVGRAHVVDRVRTWGTEAVDA